MAHHIIVEFNLDKSTVFRDDLRFPENLYLALAHRYQDNERILSNYGIKVLNEHHSSDCKEIVVQACNCHEALLGACKTMIRSMTLGRVNATGVNRVKSYEVKPEDRERFIQAIAKAEQEAP